MQSPFAPRAAFVVDKTSGIVNKDTFSLTNKSILATSLLWQITPTNGSAKFAAGTTMNSTNPRVVFTQAGLYSVSLLASNALGTDDTSATDLIQVTDPNNQIKHFNSHGFQVYPNPTSGMIYIRSAATVESVDLFTADGRVIRSGVKYNQAGMEVQDLAPGLYLLRINSKNASDYFPFCKE
jgi:PKD repeat protein